MKFLFLACFIVPFWAIGFTPDEQVVLSTFFDWGFKNSEFGYVYYGLKPICWAGYWKEDPSFPGNDAHKATVILREGMRVWGNVKPPSSPFFIAEFPNPFHPDMVALFVVNEPLLLTTIDQNKYLFKSKFGYKFDGDLFAQAIREADVGILWPVCKDYFYTGIFLGFGAKNSLVVSHTERLLEELSPAEIPPQKGFFGQQNGEKWEEKVKFLSSKPRPSVDKEPIKPSIGFQSLQEELDYLFSITTDSSNQLLSEKPYFYMGRVKEDQESARYVKDLEKGQKKIQEFVERPKFVAELIETLTGKPSDFLPPTTKLLQLTDEEIRSLPKVLTDSVYDLIKLESSHFKAGFLQGMVDSDKDPKMPLPSSQALRKKIYFDHLLEASKNLAYAEKTLQGDKTRFKTISKGKGRNYDREKLVLLHYSLKMGEKETLLTDTYASNIPQKTDLSQCIQGLALVLEGCQIGEEREIWIHPSLGYGLYTTLEKGQLITGRVTLLAILEEERMTGKTEELAMDIPPDIEELWKQNQWASGYFFGVRTWNHYKRCPHYTLEDVQMLLSKKKEGLVFHYPESLDRKRTLDRLHWNIYFQEGYHLTY